MHNYHRCRDNSLFAVRLFALRRRMEKAGTEKGLQHPVTMELSRRVDELVNEVQTY